MDMKGYFYTTDALIASAIIVSAVLLTSVFYIEKGTNSDVNYLANDLINVLSGLTVGETGNNYLASIVADGTISENELNNSILEQIGRFWAEGRDELAGNLSREVINTFMPDGYSYGVWMNDDEAYNLTSSEVSQLFSYKRMISGIERDKPIDGFISTIYLQTIKNALTNSFTYFGGFIGEGNVSQMLLLPVSFTNMSNIREVKIEVDAGNDFVLLINGNNAGNFSVGSGGGGGMVPDSWILPQSARTYFRGGVNNITLIFQNISENYTADGPHAIGGGFLQVRYFFNETEELGIEYHDDGNATIRYYFPGIEGLINVYDSFYIPGTLINMSAYLNFRSNYSTFFNIGPTNVFYGEAGTETDQEVWLNSTHMGSLFNLSELSAKTIPIRIGHPEIAAGFGDGEADVVLITDLSGSMLWDMVSENTGIIRDCDDPLLYRNDTRRLSLAKCLAQEFIDIILENSGNRVALSAFYGDTSPPHRGKVFEETLNDDAEYLKGKVDAYIAKGGTCICCAENDAYKILFEESNPARKKFVIVMSDGIPTHTCQAASGCEGTRTGLQGKEGLWLGAAGCYGGVDDCESNACDCAITNTIWSACRLQDDLEATVFSIGFGPVEPCTTANTTLKEVALCGGGEYYSSDNGTILREIYQDIANTILALSYENQSAVTTGNLLHTFLYPGSYIEVNFTPFVDPPVYGKIPITVDGNQFGNTYSNGTLYLPGSADLIELKASSYSGNRWTSLVTMTNDGYHEAYNLSSYGAVFPYLGDAFIVNVPVSFFRYGMDNTVSVRTGTLPLELSGGSEANRLIYSVRVDRFINPGGVFTRIIGCNWSFELEDGSFRQISIPAGYNGSMRCYYNSTSHELSTSVYDAEDGLQYGAFQVFSLFDFNRNGRVAVDLTENNLNITSYHQSGVPSMWGPAIAEVRVWK